MEQVFINFVNNSSVFQKGLFLMIAGVFFVFLVQVVFYTVVKIWPKDKK